MARAFKQDGIEYSTYFDNDGNEWVPIGRVDFDEAKGHYVFTRRYPGHDLSETPFQVESDREEGSFDPSFRYTPGTVCNACRAILQVCTDKVRSVSAEGGSLTLTINVGYGLRQLRQSAMSGCHLCSLFESSILATIRHGQPSPKYRHDRGLEYDYVYFEMTPSGNEAALYNLRVVHGSEILGWRSHGRLVTIYPLLSMNDSTQKPDEARLTPSLGRDTGDDATFALAKDWLHECNSQHQHSARPRPSQELEIIRLLYLHRKNTEVAARLVNYVDDMEYLALSHCWGDQRHVPRLFEATEATMKKGINLSGFPRTFLDAMEITLRLGYKYLWVDSLCIMQDVEEDWRQQSSVMSLVYQTSALTIAALGSSDSRGGCFTAKRNPLALHPLSVNTLGLRVEPQQKSWSIQLELDASGPLAPPLHTRAWVVQERLSAPRTLYYSCLGIYWECETKIRSESHVEENSRYRDSVKKSLRDALIVTAGKQSAPRKILGGEGQHCFQDHWYKFLQLYTPCFLTYPTDKLIAIRSMIRDIENSGCRPNLLGLWTDNLAAELIWFVEKPEWDVLYYHKAAYEIGSRLENGLPSWTWASVHGEIRYSSSAGTIDWEPYIDQSEADRNILKIHTYRRSVEINENEEITLVRSDTTYSGWGGDLDDEYSSRWDTEPNREGLLWIILIQRKVISEQPRLRGARCLLIHRGHGDDYERVGIAQVRYGRENDNPFNTNGQSETEVIRLV